MPVTLVLGDVHIQLPDRTLSRIGVGAVPTVEVSLLHAAAPPALPPNAPPHMWPAAQPLDFMQDADGLPQGAPIDPRSFAQGQPAEPAHDETAAIQDGVLHLRAFFINWLPASINGTTVENAVASVNRLRARVHRTLPVAIRSHGNLHTLATEIMKTISSNDIGVPLTDDPEEREMLAWELVGHLAQVAATPFCGSWRELAEAATYTPDQDERAARYRRLHLERGDPIARYVSDEELAAQAAARAAEAAARAAEAAAEAGEDAPDESEAATVTPVDDETPALPSPSDDD